ncbi:MAG: hypothetical protein V1754_14755 [Pseudomonadota bacterium]
MPSLTRQIKFFLSFVQRVDLLMLSQRLEKQSRGALYGRYGQNFMPYSASKLKNIELSLVNRTYSLLLGSKMHGLGLRTYRDGTIGLEIRTVSDPEQLDWYAETIRTAIGKGALGEIRYDSSPLEFKPIGGALVKALKSYLLRVKAGSPRGSLSAWVDGTLRQAGLDHRLSFPLLSWERQPFIPGEKHQLIEKERRLFIDQMARLLASTAAKKIGIEALREGAINAIWRFSKRCQLSTDLERSITVPLRGAGTWMSIISQAQGQRISK